MLSTAYTYDGTFDGFLSAVFAAYENRETPEEIVEAGVLQEVFGRVAREISTVEARARRVEKGIVKTMGSPAFEKIWQTFLSGEPDKATLLYRYIRRGFEIGRGIYNNISHNDVLPIEKLHFAVTHEAHLLTGFVRFSEMEGGIFYSKITPKNSVIPLIMPHFVDRFSIQPMIVHDAAHNLVGVYDLKEWYLVETDNLNVPAPDENELNYRRMWKSFYESIAIMERTNPVCRRSLMPMRFWPNMTEHGYIPPKKPAQETQISKPIVRDAF